MSRSAKYNTQNHRRITVGILTTSYEELHLIKVFILLSGKSFSCQARIVRRGLIFKELLSMGCYLEDYRERVATWAARTSWRKAHGNGRVIFCLGIVILCANDFSCAIGNWWSGEKSRT